MLANRTTVGPVRVAAFAGTAELVAGGGGLVGGLVDGSRLLALCGSSVLRRDEARDTGASSASFMGVS
jgi:hypothetical protein